MTIQESQRPGRVRVREYPPRVVAGSDSLVQIESVTFFNLALETVGNNLELADHELIMLIGEEFEGHRRANIRFVVQAKEEWLRRYSGEEYKKYRPSYERTVRLMEEIGYLPKQNRDAVD